MLFQLTTALQHGRHKKKISFFLFPAPLGQICFVLVLISPNHKARNRYPEMVMALLTKISTYEKGMTELVNENKSLKGKLLDTTNQLKALKESFNEVEQ